jgi:hypothetical protein
VLTDVAHFFTYNGLLFGLKNVWILFAMLEIIWLANIFNNYLHGTKHFTFRLVTQQQ